MQVALADPEAARMAVEVERVADDTGWQRKSGRQPIPRGPMAFRLEGEMMYGKQTRPLAGTSLLMSVRKVHV